MMNWYRILPGVAASMLVSCCASVQMSLTDAEKALINESSSIMRILTVEEEEDLAVLRRSSTDLNAADLASPEYGALALKLVSTLENTDGGVGLAAPQVGLSRRVVAVQRVDKEGEPIEVYADIVIEEMRGELQEGGEGCLSVPDLRGSVPRYQDITISYAVLDEQGRLREVREDVSGFAAVIFQHETDHLEGVLYIDKASLLVSE